MIFLDPVSTAVVALHVSHGSQSCARTLDRAFWCQWWSLSMCAFEWLTALRAASSLGRSARNPLLRLVRPVAAARLVASRSLLRMSKRVASSKAKSQVASANLEPEAGQQHLVESPRRKRGEQPDDEVASRAAELRRGGAKQCDIATELGLTQQQVSSMLAKHGLQSQKQLNEAEAAEAVELCQAGMKQSDVAAKFGVSQPQISRAVARGGAAPHAKAAAKRRVQDPHRNAARTSAREQREFDIMDATVFAVSEYMFVGDEYRLELLVRRSAYFGESHSKFGCTDLCPTKEAIAAGEGWWRNEVMWYQHLHREFLQRMKVAMDKWESTGPQRVSDAWVAEYKASTAADSRFVERRCCVSCSVALTSLRARGGAFLYPISRTSRPSVYAKSLDALF